MESVSSQQTINTRHVGNGIQKAFYDDPNILYISLHVYENGNFYPHGPEGNWDHCGVGPGEGKYVKSPGSARTLLMAHRNINIPWPMQGMGDGDYMYAFQQVVMPIAYEFDPDLVIGKMMPWKWRGGIL